MSTGPTRFGALCVARDWVTRPDVEAALGAQHELHRLGLPERIGAILRKRGLLTSEQVREVLLQQGAGPLRDLVPGYEIQARLGQGGMGAVYRAQRRADGAAVALKLLPPRLGNNPDFVARFVREARAVAAMAHPNIVSGLDAGCADDHYFVAMELIEGESLDQWIQRDGALHEAEVCAVGLAVADALEYASAQGLVHRDIKPANILVQAGAGPLRARVKLCDLGLAKWMEDGATAVTQTGLILGTPQYVAPEQALGVKDLDVRADLYSLGATLYHAVTGRAPFSGGAAADVALRRLVKDPEPAQAIRPEVSDGLTALLAALLARDPADRPADAAAARTALERVARGERPVPGAAHAARAATGGSAGWAAIGLLLGAVITGGAAMAFSGGRGTPPAPAAATRTKATTLAQMQVARSEVVAYRTELDAMLELFAQALDAGLAEELPAGLLDRLLAQQSRLDALERRLAALAEQLTAR